MDAIVKYNTFEGFRYTGIRCTQSCYPTIKKNNIIRALGSYMFVAESSYGESPGDIDVSYNWWGTNDIVIIRQNIVDNRFDSYGNYSGNWQVVYQLLKRALLPKRCHINLMTDVSFVRCVD